ncbi:alpha/beta hydrolase [Haliea sp. E17]|uniref:alpha/beta hydrolase n=1 Tax=Haliea sp. E17 TaxID=3401576 RepID=UPI003AAE629F
MTTRHLVDPELLPGLELLPPCDINEETLPIMRQGIAEMYRQLPAGETTSAAVALREIYADGPEGTPDVRVLLFTPCAGRKVRPLYFHIHGGGFVLGSADMSVAQCTAIAEDLDCVVASVDYRLAPETVFPGNIEDCYAGLSWVYRHAGSLGIDPQRIAVGGESAGGGLAAALALLARDRGEIPIVHQQLVYPMLEDREPAQRHPCTGEFGWTRASNAYGWRSLLGCEPGGAGVSPYAAAARAASLRGLPSTFIGVGSLDLFLESNLEYARRLSREGVPVELHVYPGAFHGSDVVAQARLTQQHLRDQRAALAAAFDA